MTLQTLQIDVPDQYRHRIQLATTVNELIRVSPPYDRTETEITAGITPIDYRYEPGNVLRFGRNTTPGATDMTSAFQAAISSNPGGRVIVPAGTYLISAATAAAAMTAPVSGVHLQGAGRGVTIIKTTAACVMFAAVDADDVSIDGITFDGQQTARLAWQRAVLMRGVRRAKVTNCRFYRIGDGPMNFATTGFGGSDAVADGTRQSERIEVYGNLIEDCWGTVAIITKHIGTKDTIITNNTIKNSSTIGISLESEASTTEYCERAVVANNIIEDCDYAHSSGLSNVSYGISITERIREVVVQGNIVKTVSGNTLSAGILVGTSPGQDDTEAVSVTVNGNVVSSITASSGRGHGIMLQAGDTSISGFSVVGNHIDACEDGITFEPAAAANTTGYIQDIAIVGNVIRNCTEFGIFHQNTGGSGELSLRRAVISGNVITDSGSHGMTLKCEYSLVSGNKVHSAGGTGITFQTGSGAGNTVSENNVSNCDDNGMTLIGDRMSVIGNTCMNNGQTAATSYGIYMTSGSNGLFMLNRCEDDQGSPTQDYGIRAPSGSTIRNNELIGNVSGTVFGGIAAHNTGTYDAGLNRTA